MSGIVRFAIVSDIHYASTAEQARGNDYELRGVHNPGLRLLLRCYRHFIWKRAPLSESHLLDRFLEQAAGADYAFANGDYSCNSGFVGISDDAACQSAKECITKLRRQFGPNFRAIYGDHELGKLSFFGGQGGMRLASLKRGREELGLEPFWQLEIGRYLFLGVTSSLIGLPVFAPDVLSQELPEWERLRQEHLAQIRKAFAELQPEQRVILFCHDPTALPFLARDEQIRPRLPQIEQTIIGHLHSPLILWKSRMLAGMPKIGFIGHTPKRLTAALHEARYWRPFNVRLCPALGGIQLLKDGGFYLAELDCNGSQPIRFCFKSI